MTARIASISIAALLLCGCADGMTSLNVHIATLNSDPAACTLSNGKKQWIVVTPGYFHVARTREAFSLVCTKPGYQTWRGTLQPGRLNESSPIDDPYYARRPHGGIDAIAGTSFEYPAIVMISMKPLAPDRRD